MFKTLCEYYIISFAYLSICIAISSFNSTTFLPENCFLSHILHFVTIKNNAGTTIKVRNVATSNP